MTDKNSPDASSRDTDALLEAITAAVPPLLTAMDTLGRVARHLHPPDVETLAASAMAWRQPLLAGQSEFAAVSWPAHLQGFASCIKEAGNATLKALEVLAAAPAESNPVMQAYRALGHATRATEALYPLAAILPAVSRFYLPDDIRGNQDLLQRLAGVDANRDNVGVMHANNSREQRGGFSLYVPEYHQVRGAPEADSQQPVPLVVALHGGSGHGRTFLWTWLRAARATGAIVLSPTSVGDTWSLMGPDQDSARLDHLVSMVAEHWHIDPQRVLLTGMSDGGTFSWLSGLRSGTAFTHLAPISASFHPMLLEVAEASRLQDLPVYLVHGALDWMFPVAMARAAHQALAAAGAAVTFRELADLSHSYPQEENSKILDWMSAPDR